MSLKDKISVSISAVNPVTNEYNYADLTFPATSMEVEDAFQKARITKGGEYFVEILSCPDLPDLCNTKIDGRIEMKELNLLAKRMQVLSEDELTVLGGLFKSKLPDENASLSLEEIINMTYGLDSVTVVHGITTDEQVGEFVIDNGLSEELLTVSDEVMQYVDPKLVGEIFREQENGVFYNSSYIPLGMYTEQNVYKSPTRAELEVRNDIAFGLKIAEAPVNDSEETIDSAEWIYLPIDKNYANDRATVHNEGCIEDCVYFGFKSAFPSIDEEVFDDMLKFDKLNEIATRYVRLDDANRIKFKAVVEKVEPQTLDEVLEISDNLNRYEWSYYSAGEDNFGKEYLARHLPTGFDLGAFDGCHLNWFGDRVLERINAGVTDYGAVSDIDRSLFEVIRYSEQEQKENQIQTNDEIQDDGYGGMTM